MTYHGQSAELVARWQAAATGIGRVCRRRRSMLRSSRMELAIRVQIEELAEGVFLATSDELSGLVAQGRTVAEALEIARDIARKLIEARRERGCLADLPTITERRDYTIVVPA
jgi:predicted RNase H-like HicB family nuclease